MDEKTTAEPPFVTTLAHAAADPFRLLVEGVKDYAIFMLDPSGNVSSWNPGAEKIKGYKADEVIGKHFSCFYPADDVAAGKPQRELDIALQEGRYEEEGQRLRKDGSLFWAIVTLTKLQDGAGSHLGFANVTRDITERKQSEDRLRASKERFHLLVEGVKDYAIFMLDIAGNVVTWNSGAALVFGYKADDVIGHSYSEFFRAEDVAIGHHQKELDQAAAEGRFDSTGWRVREDGSHFWANGVLTALFNENGEVRGFAKVTKDLTKQHRQDRLLRSVLDHTIDSIICLDHLGTIETFNAAAEKAFGYSQSEVIGKNVNILIPEPPHIEPDAYLSNFLQTGVAKILGIGRDMEALRKNGSMFPVRLEVSEFHAELDGSRHFTCILRDQTEQRKLEHQLHQSQKMEAFGQLAGGVAHDFNNLLTIIIGYSEMLAGQIPIEDPKGSLLEQIQRAGNRAASLTRQLLAFSRQQILEPKVLNLNALVTDTEKMLQRLIGEDVQVAAHLSPTLAPVKVDPGQIEQVIMNLAVNARDAMPQGGKLTIETKNVELDEAYTKTHPEVQPGRFVLLAMTDMGGGMSPEVKARIFEPFYTTKGVGKGTGLGLAVVQGIVKQSRGSIEVYSEIGSGTTFKIYLPAVQERPITRSTPGPIKPTLGTETILLVEDEDAVRSLATLALQSFGYTVLTASSGKDALRLLENRSEKIDLLMTDVVMPEISGSKLAVAVRASYPNLKVLFLSGYMDDAIFRHGILQEEVAFLQKPFTLALLATKVREVLDNT